MNKLFTKIGVAMVGLAMAIGVGVAVGNGKKTDKSEKAEAANGMAIGDEITTYSGIRSGYSYKIVYVCSDTDHYLTTSISSNKGSVNSDSTKAGVFLFESTGTANQWYISFINGTTKTYIKPNNANAEVSTSTNNTGMGVTAETISSKIGLYVTYSSNKWYMAANSSTKKCGGYKSSSNQVYISKMIVAATPSAKVNITSTVSQLKLVGETTTITATRSSGSGSISYSSSNEDVATINESSGVLEAVGVGTTTITASSAGADSATLTFKVLSAHTGASANNALTITEALNFYNNLTGDEQVGPYYVSGTVSLIDTTTYQSVTDYILDGTTFDFYGPTAGEGIDLSDIVVGAVVVGYGEITEDEDVVFMYEPEVVSITVPKYTVSFNANGGTGTMSDIENVPSGYYDLPSCTFEHATSGRIFVGWKANNDGDILAVGSKYLLLANTTFYAQWNYVTGMSWTGTSASQFTGIAGTTQLTKAITDTWTVSATWSFGDPSTGLKFGDYTLRIGDSKAINSLPYTWDIEDNGKQLYVIYNSFAYANATAKPSLVEHLNSVISNESVAGTYTWTAANNQDIKTKTTGNLYAGIYAWDYTRTDNYISYVGGGTAAYQLGKSGAPDTITLRCSFPGTITNVSVTLQSSGGTHDLTITVGGGSFYSSDTTPSTMQTVSQNGTATGEVVITIDNGTSYVYLKSIAVTLTGNADIQYANKSYTAQKAALEYIKSFNDALDDICKMDGTTVSDDLATAWSTLSSAFSTKVGGLSSDSDKNTFKKLFAKATPSVRNPETGLANTGDSLQQMLARYDWILSVHKTLPDFLNTVASRTAVSRSIGVLPEFTIVNNNEMLIAITIISITCVASFGAMFVLRKKKEQ